MANYYSERSRKNGVAKYPNAGLTQRIRELLVDGPMTAEALAHKSGAAIDAVRSCINQMIAVTGGVVRLTVQGPPQYALYTQRRTKKGGSGVIAGPKVIRGYLW